MINIKILFLLMAIHWFADFVIQTHNQATKKSHNNKALLSHTFDYSLFWLYAISFQILFFGWPIKMLLFVPITFVLHTITDYFTSRACKYYRERENYHNFFVIIGIDQFLHMLQIVLTFYFIMLWN